MALPFYLAMTAAEIQENSSLPPQLAYMACHFSPYGTGLSNLPQTLPEGSLLILNDRTPIHGHDPELVIHQLEAIISRFHCRGILLDFQRPECEETMRLARALSAAPPCPTGVSYIYAQELSCPVFLPPVSLDVPLAEHLRPWKGREIWLDTAREGQEILLTPEGYASTPLPCLRLSGGFACESLHCHYQISTGQEHAAFTLFRTREDLDSLLTEAEALGVTQAVGLWQEFSHI